MGQAVSPNCQFALDEFLLNKQRLMEIVTSRHGMLYHPHDLISAISQECFVYLGFSEYHADLHGRSLWHLNES